MITARIHSDNKILNYKEFILPQIPIIKQDYQRESIEINEDLYKAHMLIYTSEKELNLYLIKMTDTVKENPAKLVLICEINDEDFKPFEVSIYKKHTIEEFKKMNLPRIPQTNWEFIKMGHLAHRISETIYKPNEVRVIIELGQPYYELDNWIK